MRIDGRVVDRASAQVRAGSVVSFPRGDQLVVVRVEGLAEARGPYDVARHLYTDLGRASTGDNGWRDPADRHGDHRDAADDAGHRRQSDHACAEALTPA